ncbi:hypothetical protein GCM10011577_33020 [Pseudarthrobacter polychromogenes]|uniref:Uncharacterized protein n=1 Tax=Pseudarthrobacter polychromogenes TaxID=1676 RepID=A0ABQ1XY89_9MICC|nr:hypothetical protein GCM10011577_33020 [Pseudarthrobacter polychromogenes]
MIQALLCKFGIHHHWHIEHTEDGGLYKRCLRCGKGESGRGATNGWALKKWWT